VDLNAVLRTAVKLSQPQWKTLNIEVSTVLQPDLPRVLGDSNQLLQVCVQLLNGAINAVERQGCGLLTITAEHKDGMAVIHIFDAGTAVSTDSTQPPAVEDAVLKHASARPLSGLGLSACQGILQQHHGKIFWQSDQNCGTSIRVELPVIAPASQRSPAAGGPQKWQPQPFS
jgi:C4-dicarboxylate-specific signal transduction histidine kinase